MGKQEKYKAIEYEGLWLPGTILDKATADYFNGVLSGREYAKMRWGMPLGEKFEDLAEEYVQLMYPYHRASVKRKLIKGTGKFKDPKWSKLIDRRYQGTE